MLQCGVGSVGVRRVKKGGSVAAPGGVGALHGVRSGALCGAATGAACLLAMLCPEYAATELIPELMDWFEDQCAQRFGGVCCRDIVGQDALKRKMICPGLVADTYGKARELLEEYGYQFEA